MNYFKIDNGTNGKTRAQLALENLASGNPVSKTQPPIETDAKPDNESQFTIGEQLDTILFTFIKELEDNYAALHERIQKMEKEILELKQLHNQ